MSISGISSNSYNPYQTGANPLQQQFQQLGQALQSGNLSAAQSDFASLRQAFRSPPALRALRPLLAQARLPATRSIRLQPARLRSSVGQPVGGAEGLFRHPAGDEDAHVVLGPQSIDPNHLGGKGGDYLRPKVSEIGQDASSSTSNLAAAQQSYATLEQQLQQFALGGTALTPDSLVSFDA